MYQPGEQGILTLKGEKFGCGSADSRSRCLDDVCDLWALRVNCLSESCAPPQPWPWGLAWGKGGPSPPKRRHLGRP